MLAQASTIPEIEVVAAILRDPQGRVLIADRPAGKPWAAYWEFPGGKLEEGEAQAAALKRELREELGIAVEGAYRLFSFSYRYPERLVHLHVWRVTRWQGTPVPYEGQILAWHELDALPEVKLLPADQPILDVLRLPLLILVTPPPGNDLEQFLQYLESSLKAGVDWVLFRAPGLSSPRYAELAEKVVTACHASGAYISLHGDAALAARLGAHGVHLAGRDLAAYRGREQGLRLGISCHSLEEMHAALKLEPDYLILGPVRETASHPGAPSLGWEKFRELAAASRVPIYAIGGLGPIDLAAARDHGGHGVASIRALWNLAQLSELS